jgi:surface antigen
LSAFPTPYTGAAKARQIARPVALLVLALTSAALAGCSTLALPFGPQIVRVSMETTAAIPAKGSTIDAVDASDWEVVRRTVASIPASDTRTLDWTNPATRSSGSVTVAAAPDVKTVTACRPFATTVSDSRGIRRYRGEACREIGGRWLLTGVSADDAVLS